MTRYCAAWIFILSVLFCMAGYPVYADEADDIMDQALSEQLSSPNSSDTIKEEKKSEPVQVAVAPSQSQSVTTDQSVPVTAETVEAQASAAPGSDALASSVVSSADATTANNVGSVAPVETPVEAAPAPQVSEPAPAVAEKPVVEAPVVEEPVRARDVLTGDEKRSGDTDTGELADGEVVDEGTAASAKLELLNQAAEKGQLLVADFDSGDKPNNLGGDFGAWDKDPNEDTQGCKMSFAADDYSGNPEGFALRLDYDVDSPRPAYNGLYMKLENTNALPYDTLSFYVRGIAPRYTKRLKVELKTPDYRSSDFFVSGITDQWQKIEIPLKRFKGIKNWATLGELILVFDDVNTYRKRGTLLVDQIMFERKVSGMPQPPSTQKPAEDWEGTQTPA